MKVYVITKTTTDRSEYNYPIDSVFAVVSSEERAKEMCENYTTIYNEYARDEYSYDEFEVDEI